MSYSKTAVGLLVAFLILALSGCGAAEAAPRSYNGTWKSSDGTFVAKISKNHIDIVMHADDVEGLYWRGTFPGKGNIIVSKADQEALKLSLLGSQDKTKRFVYRNRRLEFRFRMLGMTQTVRLKKV